MWLEVFAGVFPSSVEVCSAHVAAEVPVDYAVDVDHGKYFEGEFLEELFASRAFKELP